MRKKERERDRGGLREREGLRKSVCYTSFPLSLSHTHPELNVNGVSLSLYFYFSFVFCDIRRTACPPLTFERKKDFFLLFC